MELSTSARNRLVGQMAAWLDGGSIVFLDGIPGRRNANRLVELPLPIPAFLPEKNGEALALEIPTVLAILSGDISWAQLVSPTGEILANLTVADTPGADLTLNRLDVQRGGEFTLSALVLRLPAGN